jgi:hypothetical protein
LVRRFEPCLSSKKRTEEEAHREKRSLGSIWWDDSELNQGDGGDEEFPYHFLLSEGGHRGLFVWRDRKMHSRNA